MALSVASFVLGAGLFAYCSLVLRSFMDGSIYELPAEEFQAAMYRTGRVAELLAYVAIPLAVLGGIGMNIISFLSSMKRKSQNQD